MKPTWERCEPWWVGERLTKIRVASPFLLRTAVPPLASAYGREVRELRRIGKRIAIGFDGDLWLVLHLMIAGRLHWRLRRRSPRGRHIGGTPIPRRVP